MAIQPRPRAYLAGLVLAVSLSGCGGGGGGGGGGPPPAPIASLSSYSLSFGAQAMNATSPAQVITLTNIGSATLNVGAVMLSGANADQFADTTTCASVAVNASCTISVTFTPTAAGSDSATLTIDSNASSASTVSLTGSGRSTGANTVAAYIDLGPTVNGSQLGAINLLYVTITVCAPGTATCQTIDHVQVDTGSTGLRLLSSVLSGPLAAALTPVQTSAGAGHALVECTQFADGYSWGPVKTVDLTIGTESVGGVRAQIIGDAAYPSSLASNACTKGPNSTEEDTVTAFGANGLIGIGYFLQDCGPSCPSDGSTYNDCAAGTCAGYFAAVSEQLPNPVAMFATDNNGVTLELPAVAEAVDQVGTTPPVTGTIVFGVGASAGTLPGNVTVYQVNPGNSTFTARYNGMDFGASFIDSGSNGWYFPNQAPTIATCPSDARFYCPSQGVVQLQATIYDYFTATNTAAVEFKVYDLSQLTQSTAAAGGLGGVWDTTISESFDFGLPFFYGKSVYLAFEGSTLNGEVGPAFAY